MLKHLLSLLLFVQLLNGIGQDPHHIQYSTSNGLSSTEIYDVIQDEWGYLWISSDHGLNRYDGNQFEHFSTEDGLTDNTVFRFKKDPYGRIWCTTYNSTIFLIEGKEPHFIPYKYNQQLQEALEYRVLKDLYFDSHLNLYVTVVVHNGYIKIEPNGNLHNYISQEESGGITLSLEQLDNHQYFLCSKSDKIRIPNPGSALDSIPLDDPLYYRNLFESGSFFPTEDKAVFGINDYIIISHKDGSKDSISLASEIIASGKFSDNTFWVSSRNKGVQIYNLDGDLVLSLLDGKSISSVHIDHEGGMWVGTLLNGLYYFKDWRIRNYDPLSSSTPVSDLKIDQNQSLWLGYEDGTVFRRDSDSFQQIGTPRIRRPILFYYNRSEEEFYYLANNHIFSAKGDDSTFVAAIKGFEVEAGTDPKMIKTAKNSGIVIHFWGSDSIIKYTSKYRTLDFIKVEDEEFMATQKGLYKVIDGKVISIDTSTIFSYRYNCLEQCKGTLIAGSRGAGLVFIKGETKIVINKSAGLASDFINVIFNEGDSILWVGTNAGISKLQLAHDVLNIQNIGTPQGLIDNHITSFASTLDTLWVGTHKGLTYLVKSQLNRPSQNTDYGLHLPGIEVNDLETSRLNNLELSYDQNRIKFHFLGFTFKETNQYEYRYKLIGLESNWNYTTTNSVLYSSLDHGQYEFVVQFKGNNKNWGNETASVFITISPPFWRTGWFLVVVVLSLWYLLYLFFKHKVIIYNGDVLREILRYLLKRMRKEGPYMLIKEAGTEYKIYTEKILYVRSDRNYLEIHTEDGKHLIREKIGNFLDLVPDPIEFLRIKRSYIIRIDKVTEKGKKYVKMGDLKLEVGDTYVDALQKIIL